MIINDSNYIKKMQHESKHAYKIPLISDQLGYFFRQLSRKQFVCVDLGSHIGTFAKHYANQFSRVYCYEPSKECFDQSVQYLKDSSNVILHNSGISRNSGEKLTLREITVNGISEAKDLTAVEWDPKGLGDFQGKLGKVHGESDSVSWASISKEISEPIYFLKCDIEGGEYNALIAADLSNVTFLAMELHYSALGEQKVNHLVSHLLEYFDPLNPTNVEDLRNWPPPSMVYMVSKNAKIPVLWLTRIIVRVQKFASSMAGIFRSFFLRLKG